VTINPDILLSGNRATSLDPRHGQGGLGSPRGVSWRAGHNGKWRMWS
jgi:hypothetical protein